MGFYVGIDLGTTNSTVSVIRTEEYEDDPLETLETCPIFQYNERLKYLMGDQCLPSALYFDIENKKVYTGQYAKAMYASGDRPMQTIRSIKTRMGGESLVEIPGIKDSSQKETFDMVQCASLFIRTIVQSLKERFPDVDVTREAVVTVPAAFNDDERVATQNAVLLGGFRQCLILDEPTAALLSYLNSSASDEELDDRESTYRLVYDIGGGTLDVSIAEVKMNEDGDYDVVVKGLSERMNLGGDDFDRLLAADFLMEFEESSAPIESRSQDDQNRIIARIVSNAEDYKIDMNNRIVEIEDERKLARLKRRVSFELIDNMYVEGVMLDKSKIDDLYSSFTNSQGGRLLKPIKSALRNAGIDAGQIDEVILTGGMSKFYAVPEVLQTFFGSEVPLHIVEDTRTAVSRGGALYHWSKDEDNESDNVKKVSSISERMASNIYLRKDNGFELLIADNLEQTRGTFYYTVTDSNMTHLPLFLYSGSNSEAGQENFSSFIPLTGKRIPLRHAYDEGDRIELAWSVDKNKVITVELEESDYEPISFSRQLKLNDIKENPIQQYIVNKG